MPITAVTSLTFVRMYDLLLYEYESLLAWYCLRFGDSSASSVILAIYYAAQDTNKVRPEHQPDGTITASSPHRSASYRWSGGGGRFESQARMYSNYEYNCYSVVAAPTELPMPTMVSAIIVLRR